MLDPNGIGIKNGNLFGISCDVHDAELVVIPVPWDATASHGKGSADGPAAILNSSTQLDFYSPLKKDAWKSKIHLLQIPEHISELNEMFSDQVKRHLTEQESGLKGRNNDLENGVNQAQYEICKWVNETSIKILNEGKIPVVLGGEHSCPLGLIQALAAQTNFGILQIDAHADLRVSYTGFDQSHASIMHNALKIRNVERLVQVGVRDLGETEAQTIEQDDRISCFFDWDLKSSLFHGKTWNIIVKSIIEPLPPNVYISFDIDGLQPNLCPNTGTPVPAGLKFEEAAYLLHTLAKTRKIIGFDLCEVVPGHNEWDANVGARILWELSIATLNSQNASPKEM